MSGSAVRGPAVAFSSAAVGTWGDVDVVDVARERIIRYAEATNDPIDAHRKGEVGPPVFAVVPSFPSIMRAVSALAPPEARRRAVHGAQDFRFHRPIRPGDTISTRAKPLGYAGAANGTAAAFLLECRDGDGELVNEQYMTAFFRGVDAGETVGGPAPSHRFDETLRAHEPVAVVTQHIDDDQTFRYALASGDSAPIHLDEEVARGVGLPGIIVHGLCTQAFTSWAILTAVADGDSTRLKRHAGRFARPVLPGQDITTSIWRVGSADGATRYAFETTADGVVVMRDGLADIAD